MNKLKQYSSAIINYIKSHIVEQDSQVVASDDVAKVILELLEITTPCSIEHFEQQLNDLNTTFCNTLAVPMADGSKIKFYKHDAYIRYAVRITDNDGAYTYNMDTIKEMIMEGYINIDNRS